MAPGRLEINFPAEICEVITAALSKAGFDTFEQDSCNCIRLYLEDSSRLTNIKSTIAEFLARGQLTESGVSFSLGDFADTDWQTEWKKHWQPTRISPTLIVCPSHCEYAAREGETVVLLDTTYAFGTGTHPTTRSCLELLESECREGGPESFLDIGCGSGILSIAAAKLGVPSVYGIDTDTEACYTSQANAVYNELEGVVFSDKPLAQVTIKAQLVCANILSSVILENWQHILRTVLPGGKLILSGLLEDEVAEFVATLKIKPLRQRTEDGWATLLSQC